MLRIHNTLTRQIEPFEPLEPGQVRIYTCGPTVHDFAHIGNYRAYMFEDLLRRFLIYRGYKVTQVMNITDVEDKIIRKSIEQNVGIDEITAPLIEAFFRDLDILNIERAEHYPRATRHIDDMVALVQKLIDRGHAYEQEGSYYFSIDSFPKYGSLVSLEEAELKPGIRVEADEYHKEDLRDFALWKAPKPGEHFWDTAIGPGRPGWHIECSAMSMRYLGETFDIHAGGEDNIFPHHENEIAQSEAATGKQFVRYWMHCRHLIVDGKKMSKSAGNFYTLGDLLQKGYDPRAIRYLLITTHYRKQLNFSIESLDAAASAIKRLDEFVLRLQEETFPQGSNAKNNESVEHCRSQFSEALDNDLNISAAIGAVFNLVKQINTAADEDALRTEDAGTTLDLLKELNWILGFIKFEQPPLEDKEIEDLIKARNESRARRDFAEADRIRDLLIERGIILQDTPEGTRFRRKTPS